ncbi:MAG: hypothetical protein ISQ99_06145 [Flavobacteriales bacterium]|nr:hypothetical protein [Flavobacteriales bacterium]MBL6869634.1 hypothetical protein [Flavobacteriales bacterium]
MNSIKTYGFLFFIIFSFNLNGQENFKNEGERIKYANNLFEEQKFIEAEPHMSNFLSNKNNSEYNFKYGVCVLFKYADKSKSIPYLKKAIKDSEVDPRAYFYLGRVYHYNYLFQDALNQYKKYKSLASSKQAKSLNLEMYINMSENGQSLMKNLSDIVVIDKKTTSVDKFNYSYDLKDIGGRILVTEEFQTKIDKKKNHKSIIYFPPLNQDILFYSSYGEVGDNGLDIYFKKRLSGGGWSSPKILPENINSPYDEDFPFLNSNGTTFYFSSMGHNSMGGYDIFRCNYDATTNDFGPISNLDYKINSTDDDILYLVDKNNKNAIFSSKRSSEGGMIDVYNVKVQLLPMQNIIISGSFKNSILPEDFQANIKVQDVRTNKLIGSYNVDKESNYNILLPNSGKYKFIVETPKSEKIHAGLVEAPPQTELKALKQEIELVKINGEEKLIIKDYFDQSPENEAVIIANLLKEMSNPKINIDQYPDSILDKMVESQSEELVIDTDPSQESNLENDTSENEIINFSEQKDQLLNVKNERLNDLKEQSILVSNIAKLKSEESIINAQKADDILLELESEENDSIKNIQLKLAAKFNATSKRLSQEVSNAVAISKRMNEEIILKEKEILIIQELDVQEDLVADNNQEVEIIESIKVQLSDPSKEKSTVEIIQQQSREKEEKAKDLLENAEEIKSEKQALQSQLKEEKLILSSTKKRKKIDEQNSKINELESKISNLESDVEDKISQYDELVLEKKQLEDQAKDLQEIKVSQKYKDIPLESDLDLEDIEIENESTISNYIEKNDPQLESVVLAIVDNGIDLSYSTEENTNVGQDSSNSDDSTLENNKGEELKEDLTLASSENTTGNISDSSVNISKKEDDSFKKESVIKEKKNIEFVENLPLDIPIAKEFIEIPAQTVNGVTFNSESEPETYQVVAEVDKEVVFVQNKYENQTNNKIIEINKKSIDKINVLSNETEELELQKLDMDTDKKKAKVDKKIGKINKKKAKAQLKIADDIAFVNDNEIKHLNREISSNKKEFEADVKESFKFKQAEKYEVAANELNAKSVALRDQANSEKDKVKKGKLIEEAIEFENTAINYLVKSKKLYSDAIVEDFSDDKLSVAKTLNPNQLKQSVRLEKLSDVALQESKIYSEKAVELTAQGDVLGAKEYENLAAIQKKKSSNYLEKSLDFKKIEMAIVEDIEISKSLVDAEVITIASSNEFKSFYESETEVRELEIENQKLKAKKEGYLKMYDQMVAKADALEQQSKTETDISAKKDLINASKNLKIEAKKNKEFSEAIIYSMDSVKREIKNKQMSQALVLEMLDSTQKTQIKALAISGKADSVLALLPEEFVDTTDLLELDSLASDSLDIIEQEVVQDVKLPEVKPEIVPVNPEDILSKNFVPPTVITQEIFLLTDEKVYSQENPIPLNPKIPKGLIFKVQVGAFRNPIPQDLFQGFAPISAEKVRDDITRYRVGYFKTYQDANQAKNQIRGLSSSYRDAFVVAINNGERIKLSEARAILSNQPIAILPPTSPSSTNSLSNLRTEIAQDLTLASVKTIDQTTGIFYSVQIGAFSKPLLKENALNISPLVVSRVNNLYKYSTGEFNTIELAARRKAELIDDGILTDAFIIAYNNGRSISLQQANSANPDRVVEYENPTIYYIDFGTYGSDIPVDLNGTSLKLRDFNVKSRSRFGGSQFFSKKYNSLTDAQIALNSISSDVVSNSKIIKSTRDDFSFNYEYKIEIGVFNDLTDELQSKFDKLKTLDIKGTEINGVTTYYSKSRDDYDSITTDLNACKSQNLENSKIVVFKDGILTKIEETLNSFK